MAIIWTEGMNKSSSDGVAGCNVIPQITKWPCMSLIM